MTSHEPLPPSPAVTERLVDIATGWAHPAPADAARAAGIAFADTVGCALAGVPDPAVTAYVRATGHFPFDNSGSPADAARVAGLAAHALDYDDVDDATISHPSAVMVPALLAVGADRRTSGAEVVTAFHRGLAVGRTLGAALGIRAHYEAGWHTTSTVGTVAATAAVGSLLGLDAPRVRAALGIAGSLAQGSRQNFGSMTKPLHAGQAAHNAVLAATLAEQDFTADHDALEGPLGFLSLHRGHASAPPTPGTDGATITGDADLARPFLNVKLYPCCYYTHAAADAAREVREDLLADGIHPDQLASVHVTVQPGGLAPLVHPRPVDGTQAKFSMEFVLAAMLSDGEVTLTTFAAESVARPDLRRLLARVTAAEAEVPPLGSPTWSAGYAVVVATTEDGRTVSRRIDRPRGHATRPVDEATLRTKFDDCLAAAGIPSTGDTDTLFGTLASIADQESITDVAAVITDVLATRAHATGPATGPPQPTTTSATEGLRRPLDGVVVVALEQAVAAPFASRQLADLGARVIKVERPGGGDFARAYDAHVGGTSSAFLWLGRGKESVVLDLKDDEGRARLEQLLQRADVFLQNLSPAAARRAGLDPDAVQERHPHLIACGISGYGEDGPMAAAKAYDLLVQAESGLIDLTGDGDVQAKVGISIADIAAGSYAYSSILAALHHRLRFGEALPVKISMLEALAEWLSYPLHYAVHSGAAPLRRGTSHATIAPYGAFATGDGGQILFAVQNDREWRRLCDVVLGDPTLADDPLYVDQPSRVAHADALEALIEDRLSTLTTEEARGLLEEADIAVARLNSISALKDHEQLRARDRWVDTPYPGGATETLRPPWTVPAAGGDFGAVPALGEHTEAVLAWLDEPPADPQAPD